MISVGVHYLLREFISYKNLLRENPKQYLFLLCSERAIPIMVYDSYSYIEKQKAHHSCTHNWTKKMLALFFPLIGGLEYWLEYKPCLNPNQSITSH